MSKKELDQKGVEHLCRNADKGKRHACEAASYGVAITIVGSSFKKPLSGGLVSTDSFNILYVP